jgi:hypothetical protein
VSGLDPEFADALRDALALVRCALAGDPEGTAVVLAGMADDPGRAGQACELLADLCAEVITQRWPGDGTLDRLARVQRLI